MQTQTLHTEIDILRRQLDHVRGERDMASAHHVRALGEIQMLRTLNQAKEQELCRLRAEVESRKGELDNTLSRAAQAMAELNDIINKLHRRLDEVCDSWAGMVRVLPMGEDVRQRNLEVVDSFRTPLAVELAE